MHFLHRYIAPLIVTAGVLIAAAIFVLGALPVLAQEVEEEVEHIATEAEKSIAFPVAELGNCENKQACKEYCNSPDNIEACVAFAESHGLMKKEEAAVAKKFARSITTHGGPGGCTGPQSCKAYCEDISHIEECIAFAEANGHSDSDVQEGKKVAAFIKQGGQLPGGCTSRQRCETYCSEGDHMEECIAFAESAGLEMRGPEGQKMGIEQMKKVHAMMQSGETPGGCKSRAQCESFCESPDNAEQCLSFAERAGFMPQEEIARARKMMQHGGPGGCRGRAACEAYCSSPENQEACMAFAEESGMMRPEDVQRMREMRATFEQGMQQMQEMGGPQGMEGQGGPRGPSAGIGNCVRDKITSIMSSGGVPNQGIMQEAVQECMSQAGHEGGFSPEGGFGPQGEFEGRMGPGGEFDHRGMPPEGGEGMHEGEGGMPFMGGGMEGEHGDMPMRSEDAMKFMQERGMNMEDVKGMMQKGGQMMPREGEHMMPSSEGHEGEGGSDDMLGAEFQKQFQGEAQKQFQEEFQKQYQQQYQQQSQMMQGGTMPQGGMMPSGDGGMMMPPSGSMPSGGTMMPPPPPQSIAPMNRMVASVFQAVLALYGFK